MKAYKANTLKWTQANGYETTDNIVIGLLNKKTDAWTIAYEVEEGASAKFMVDKETVQAVEAKKVTDDVGKVYWFEEVNDEQIALF